MINVYYLDCSALCNAQELTRILPLLDETRREKTQRYKIAERQAQSAGAGLLLRYLFGDADYAYGKNGKPYLRDRQNLFFSLSHSEHHLVCAVADTEIGVDIEPVSTLRPAVMRRCFTREEQEWIGDDATRFSRLWTMKEAYMKWTGSGLSVPANEILLPLPPQDGPDLGNRCAWTLLELHHIPITVCTGQPMACRIETADLSQLIHRVTP